MPAVLCEVHRSRPLGTAILQYCDSFRDAPNAERLGCSLLLQHLLAPAMHATGELQHPQLYGLLVSCAAVHTQTWIRCAMQRSRATMVTLVGINGFGRSGA